MSSAVLQGPCHEIFEINTFLIKNTLPGSIIPLKKSSLLLMLAKKIAMYDFKFFPSGFNDDTPRYQRYDQRDMCRILRAARLYFIIDEQWKKIRYVYMLQHNYNC